MEIWSILSNKIGFLPSCSYLYYCWEALHRCWQNRKRMLHVVLNKFWLQNPTKQATVISNHPSKRNKTCRPRLEKQGWTWKQRLLFICSVQTLDTVWRSYKGWMIRMNGECMCQGNPYCYSNLMRWFKHYVRILVTYMT